MNALIRNDEDIKRLEETLSQRFVPEALNCMEIFSSGSAIPV
jgi:hypothetical protein